MTRSGTSLSAAAPPPPPSVHLTATRQPAHWLILGLTLVAYAALVFGYVTLTPIWQNPDEPAHFNYVVFVAQTGGLPELKAGDWDSALLGRLKNGRLLPGDSTSAIRYESWQPPLFYLAAAPVLRFGPPQADPTALVTRLRLFDALLGGLTVVVAYFVAREVLPQRVAPAVPLALVGVPMFTAVSAAVSADPLANLLAALVLVVLLRGLRRPARGEGWRQSIAAGVLLGLGLLTKLELAIFVPLALLVVVLRTARPVRGGVLLLAATAATTAPWLVHQVTTYGWLDPLATSRHLSVVADQPRFPGLSAEYVAAFLTTSFHSFWAQFGWMAVVGPDRLYWAWGLLVLLATAGLLVERRWLGEPGWRLMLATLGLALMAYVGYNLTFEQFQGRYLFTALIPFAALLVLGWATWLPRRLESVGVLVPAMLLVGLNAYALLRVLVPGFAPSA